MLNIGVLVAFYYGITGVACAWAFRKTLGKGFRANLTMVWLPLIGGLVLLFVGYWVIKEGGSTALPDIWVLGLGVPLTVLAWFRTKDKSPSSVSRWSPTPSSKTKASYPPPHGKDDQR